MQYIIKPCTFIVVYWWDKFAVWNILYIAYNRINLMRGDIYFLIYILL